MSGMLAGISEAMTAHIIRALECQLQEELTFQFSKRQLACGLVVAVTVAYLVHHFVIKAKPVYLLGFHCYKAPDRLKVSRQLYMERARQMGIYNEQSLSLQEKLVERSGLGDETYFPEGVHKVPMEITMENARAEAEAVIFTCVERVLQEHGVSPRQVDILIVNCSLFNPTPSLAAMIANRFKMRSNIVSYNLAGMGCSAGVISIALARDALQVYPNANCLVVSTENITQNLYLGNERNMIVPNAIFRVGGAAMLLSNKHTDCWRAKYRLLYTIRRQLAADDVAYRCVYQQQDALGNVGVYLGKELMAVAGRALRENMTALGRVALPWSEQIRFAANVIGRKVFNSGSAPYVPDFQKAFDHFCLHTGGRGVIDEIQKELRLSDDTVRASREALYRYGNVSSSSVWYVLARIESDKGVKAGEKVWQIAFGSGFKCNSAVWQAMRRVSKAHEAWS